MKITHTNTSTALALILGLGFAMPAAAQGQGGADANQDQFVDEQEATAFDEQRFDELSGGADEITQEQFTGGMTGAEEAEAEFGQADTDQGGTLNRDEWMQYRQQRFGEAAGAEGQVDAAQYETLDTGGAAGAGGTTGGGTTGGTTDGDTTGGDTTGGDTTGGSTTGGDTTGGGTAPSN